MNKKEINNLNEVIKDTTTSYYYNNTDHCYSILKGIEYTCKALEYNNYYNIVNETIILEMKQNNDISFISAKMLLDLMESINEHMQITDIIINHDLNTFLDNLEILNSEIEYINKDTYKANCNKINIIKRG